ncbi:MAG TPA: GAF domain-containing protein, partial [Candidatus Dormibacteraeota bacterium]|nr:GAF domain-containing protein [Candidatus Dormibacteraeota bacterium]
METIGTEAGHVDRLDAFQAAVEELGHFKTVPEVADAALRLALGLTRSRAAFLAVVDETGDSKRIFSRASSASDRVTDTYIERVFAAVQSGGRVAAGGWTGSRDSPAAPPLRSTCARPLEAAGESVGMIGIANPAGYTAVQLQTFSLLAHQVAGALAIARLNERRQEMVDTLINLRADLDRSERQRLIDDERVRSAERVEHAHEAAVEALLAVSRHARTNHGLTDFYQRLTHSI